MTFHHYALHIPVYYITHKKRVCFSFSVICNSEHVGWKDEILDVTIKGRHYNDSGYQGFCCIQIQKCFYWPPEKNNDEIKRSLIVVAASKYPNIQVGKSEV